MTLHIKFPLLIVLGIFFFGTTNLIYGQENESKEVINHERYIFIGTSLRTGNITLRSFEQPTVEEGRTSAIGNINFGFSAYLNRFLGDLSVSFSPFATDFGYTTETKKFLSLQMNFGYSIWEENAFRAYPLVGFGIQRFAEEKQDDWASRVIYSVGMGGDVKIPNSNILVSLRGGYNHNIVTPTAFGLSKNSINGGGGFAEIRCSFRMP